MKDILFTAITKEELESLVAHQLDLAFKRNDFGKEQQASKTMTLADFCAHANVSRQTAYKLTSTKKVPHSKRGKRLYFDRDKVDAWLLENKVATQTDLQAKANDYVQRKGRRRV